MREGADDRERDKRVYWEKRVATWSFVCCHCETYIEECMCLMCVDRVASRPIYKLNTAAPYHTLHEPSACGRSALGPCKALGPLKEKGGGKREIQFQLCVLCTRVCAR